MGLVYSYPNLSLFYHFLTADDADDLATLLVKLFQEFSKEDCGEFNIFRWLNILKEL